MRITRTGWLGMVLVITGLSTFGARTVWSKTRTWVLVDTPISLSPHQFLIADFKSNLTAFYIVEIEVEKKIPFATLNCLLGVEQDHPENCTSVPTVVNVSWVLSTSQGVTLAQGSTADTRAGDWKTNVVARQIGSFKTEKGHHYTLDINVLTDGSRLAAGNPRLKVEVHPSYYEGFAFGDIPFVLAAVGLVLAGTITFATSTLRARHRRGTITA